MLKYDFNEVASNSSHFIEIAPQHGCSPVNLLHIFRTPFSKNASEGLLLKVIETVNHNVIMRNMKYIRIRFCENCS